MKFCPSCKTEFPDTVERCEHDGEILQDSAAAPASGKPAGVPDAPGPLQVEGTADIAGDIADLVFKVCSRCRSSFGGDLDICPHDGTRLNEHSLVGREALLFGSGGPDSIESSSENVGFENGDPGGPRTQGLLQLTAEIQKYCPKCKSHFPLHCKVCEQCGSPLAVPTLGSGVLAGPPEQRPGVLLDRKYRLLSDIGAGGFGSVYLAKHESLGKRFAVKMLRARLADSVAFRNRFHEEALKLSRLEDDSIVKVVDFGEWNDFQYMVTEYVEGRDLSALIYGEKMAALRAAKILRQVAAALVEAHSKKIVHLDLKPANILVTQKRGRDLVKVIDFGVAEIYSEARARRQESVTGTCTYMAPEQWRREALDPRADIYSFGVIFYECLAGRPPFRGRRVSELEKAHCQAQPVPIRQVRPDVPAELERLISRCLQKDRAKRIQSAEILESSLDSYVRRTERVVPAWLKIAALSAAIVGVVLGAAWGIRELGRDRVAPWWADWQAIAGDSRLVEVPAGEHLKEYRTRAQEATLVLEACDDRGIDHIVVSRGGPGERMSPEKAKRFTLPIEVGLTSVTAVAVDGAGLESVPVTLRFVRLPSVNMRLGNDFPERTNEDHVGLRLNRQDLVGGTLRIRCKSQEKTIFATEIRAETEGLFLRRDGEEDWTSIEGDTVDVQVPLEPGSNEIAFSAKDTLTGEEHPLPRDLWIVERNSTRLNVEMRVVKGEGTVPKPDAPGAWLTREPSVDLQILVAEATARIDPSKTEMRVSCKAGLIRVPWEPDDIKKGMTTVRGVKLDEGPNDIAVEPYEDRYGNRSEPVPLVVHRHTTLPQVHVAKERIPYRGEALPSVLFQVNHPGCPVGTKDFHLLSLPQDKRVQDSLYTIAPRGNDEWELRFSSAELVKSSGRHDFRIQAVDGIGNTDPAFGCFSVLSDLAPPRVKDTRPRSEAERLFRTGNSIHLAVQAEDDLSPPDELDVQVTVTMPGTSSAYGPFPMVFSPENGIWSANIDVARETAGEPAGKGAGKAPRKAEVRGTKRPGASGKPQIVKPRVFDTPEPQCTLEVCARDGANRPSDPCRIEVRFGWENGDRLRWARDGSVLVFHDTCVTPEARGRVAAFWIQECEVANDQYRRFLEASGRKRERPRSPDWSGGGELKTAADCPVRGVSVEEMEAYARWAGLALPSRTDWLVAAYWDYEEEAERLYPWRGGWPHGGAPLLRAGDQGPPVGLRQSIAEFAGGATPFGLLNMLGNVAEVVFDEELKQYVSVGGDFTLPLEVFEGVPEDSLQRAGTEHQDSRGYLRGDPGFVEALSRGTAKDDLGFRCLLRTDGKKP